MNTIKLIIITILTCVGIKISSAGNSARNIASNPNNTQVQIPSNSSIEDLQPLLINQNNNTKCKIWCKYQSKIIDTGVIMASISLIIAAIYVGYKVYKTKNTAISYDCPPPQNCTWEN